MAKMIDLGKGLNAIVDDEDFDAVSQFKWYPIRMKRRVYAIRYLEFDRKTGNSKMISMHRQLVEAVGLDVDHIDGDGLNNSRSNLRAATRAQNLWNQPKSRGKSRFKGVHWHAQNKKWRARIMKLGKQIDLGCFASEEDAAKAYDRAARSLFGDFARPNFTENAHG